MIKLGVKAKDRITGFEGIVIAKVVYLNGCIQYCLKPPLSKKGELREGEYFDEGELKVTGEGLNKNKAIARMDDEEMAEVGGNMSDMPKDKSN